MLVYSDCSMMPPSCLGYRQTYILSPIVYLTLKRHKVLVNERNQLGCIDVGEKSSCTKEVGEDTLISANLLLYIGSPTDCLEVHSYCSSYLIYLRITPV